MYGNLGNQWLLRVTKHAPATILNYHPSITGKRILHTLQLSCYHPLNEWLLGVISDANDNAF